MISPTLLYRGTLGSSAATVATTSVNGQTTINSIVATNKTANARVFSITVGGVYFAYLMPIAAYQTITLDVRQVANPGTAIQAWADATTAVDLSISCALQTPTLYLGSGTGSPEGVLTANQGAEWVQTNDSQLTYLKWRKLTGSGNTGWYPDFEGRWISYTPTVGGFTLGTGGTTTARYTQVGKTVSVSVYCVTGSTGRTPGTLTVTYPTGLAPAASEIFTVSGYFKDTGTTYYISQVILAATYFAVYGIGANGAVSIINATTPFTWAASDIISFSATYEVA